MIPLKAKQCSFSGKLVVYGVCWKFFSDIQSSKQNWKAEFLAFVRTFCWKLEASGISKTFQVVTWILEFPESCVCGWSRDFNKSTMLYPDNDTSSGNQLCLISKFHLKPQILHLKKLINYLEINLIPTAQVNEFTNETAKLIENFGWKIN